MLKRLIMLVSKNKNLYQQDSQFWIQKIILEKKFDKIRI